MPWNDQSVIRDRLSPSPQHQLQPAQSGLPYSLANQASQQYVDPSTAPQSEWDTLSRAWGLDQAAQAGIGQAAPQFALSQNYRETLAQQIALQNASRQSQSGYLNQDYATGQQRLGLQDQQLQSQRGALARQTPLNDTMHRLANELLGVNRLSANQQADRSARSALSSAVTRGAVSSPGLRDDNRDIQSQLANQLTGYDIQEREGDVRYRESKADIADQNRQLDLQAQSLNLSRDQLKTELDRGLERLGLSTQMSVLDLTSKMQSSNIEDQVLAQQIWNAALQNSDYYSQYYQTPNMPTNRPTSNPPVQVSTRASSGGKPVVRF